MIPENILKHIQSWATDEEIKGLTIFGLPAIEFSKEDLLRCLAWQEQQKRKAAKEHVHDVQFMASLHP